MTHKLFSIMAGALDVTPASISPQTSTETEARWDSLRHMQIIFAVEDAFGVRFRDEEIPRLTSVAAIEVALSAHGHVAAG